ncbi:MAG: acetyl-CoA carboxylase biotin carboxyl carrier protein [Pirellulaceae bacterium]
MSEAEPVASQVFELERIRSLVELMKEFDLREVDLREGSQRIRLARGAEMIAAQLPLSMPTASVSAAPPPAPGGQPAPTSSPASLEGPHISYIKSPMVGTFYSRPNPNAPSYVKVGEHVEPDKTICIIEAMKVFNEIPAEVRGKVVAILVNDEEPVEFGRPLFKIDTTG